MVIIKILSTYCAASNNGRKLVQLLLVNMINNTELSRYPSDHMSHMYIYGHMHDGHLFDLSTISSHHDGIILTD